MGGFVIYLANTVQMTGAPGFQVAIGRGLERVFTRIGDWADPVPEPVLGLAVLALAGVFVVATLRDRRPHPDGADENGAGGLTATQGATEARASPGPPRIPTTPTIGTDQNIST